MIDRIDIVTRPGHRSQGQLHAGGRTMLCALGRSGIGIKRREGDGVTPLGRHRLLSIQTRHDRSVGLGPVRAYEPIRPNDGWCDAVTDRNYNRRVPLPYPASHESLWREDALYDVIGILDVNIRQRLTCGGSAIFFHLATPDYRQTEGCMAISRADMRWLLPRLGPETLFIVR